MYLWTECSRTLFLPPVCPVPTTAPQLAIPIWAIPLIILGGLLIIGILILIIIKIIFFILVSQYYHLTPSLLTHVSPHPFNPHSFIPSPLNPLTHLPPHSFTPHSCTPSLLIHPLTSSPPHSCTPSPLHPSLLHLLTPSLIYLLTCVSPHSFTPSSPHSCLLTLYPLILSLITPSPPHSTPSLNLTHVLTSFVTLFSFFIHHSSSPFLLSFVLSPSLHFHCSLTLYPPPSPVT